MKTLVDRFIGWALAACLAAMACIVFTSVLFRYLLNNPLVWTDELASLLFAWLTFVGAYVGMRTRTHISIDTLVIFLPPPVRRTITRCVDVVGVLILVLFIYEGVRLAITMWSLEFPGMEISRGYLYASLPVGASAMVIGTLLRWRDEAHASPKEVKPS